MLLASAYPLILTFEADYQEVRDDLIVSLPVLTLVAVRCHSIKRVSGGVDDGSMTIAPPLECGDTVSLELP